MYNKLSSRSPKSKSQVIAYLNCFAAGIFFATCMLHMLPEVSENMKELFEVNYPIAECVAAMGFFFVLTLEQVVTACCIKPTHTKQQTIDSNAKAQSDIAGISVNIVSNSHVTEENGSIRPVDGAVQLRVESQNGSAVLTDAVDNATRALHIQRTP